MGNLLSQYSVANINTTTPRFSTSGDEGLTALQTSATASGYQQIANIIYAESTLICPSYWLASAYNKGNRKAYKIQYLIPIALHGYDSLAVFGNLRIPNQGDKFVTGTQRIVGSFVRTGSPNRPMDVMGREAGELGVFEGPNRPMLNLNQTGGVEIP